MRNDAYFQTQGLGSRIASIDLANHKTLMIGVILFVALIAFEIFNFDTTQFALESLLGDIQFAGLKWATILAIAFCAIDFAGLFRLFTPERGRDEPKAVWYLMGAWLLGATMNAAMTWWAVSLTLLGHEFGNEVLSREQLLRYVPIFVAVLVWLTRILFIGSFTMAGERLFHGDGASPQKQPQRRPGAQPAMAARATTPQKRPSGVQRRQPAPKPKPAAPQPSRAYAAQADNAPAPQPQPTRQQSSRVRQRPPMPNSSGVRRVSGVHAKSRNGRH